MISTREIWTLLKETIAAWKEDRAPSMGAALAYYTAFSLAPLLLIVIGVAALVFGRDAAQATIIDQVQGLLGADGGEAIDAMLTSASDLGSGILATVFGIAMLIFGATTAFVELQDDLDRIWKAPPRVGSGIFNLIKSRLLSFGMILGIGFLLTVSLVVSGGVSALGNYLFDGMEVLLQAANLVVSLIVITVLFAMIYKVLPNVKIEWRDVWVGAAITALLFVVGKFLIGLYIGKSDIASSFGAAGPFVVIMLWIFYSTQIFLLGAEFTYIHAQRNNPQQAPAPDAVRPVAHAQPRPTAGRSVVPAQPAPARSLQLQDARARDSGAHPYRNVALSALAGVVGGIVLAVLIPERSPLRSGSAPARSAALAAGIRNAWARTQSALAARFKA